MGGGGKFAPPSVYPGKAGPSFCSFYFNPINHGGGAYDPPARKLRRTKNLPGLLGLILKFSYACFLKKCGIFMIR